jgi:hypothetical protein
MPKQPKTTNEHLIAIYGYITGLKREVHTIKTNHLKHIHGDVEKLGGKIDKIYWVLLAAVGSVAISLLTLFLK